MKHLIDARIAPHLERIENRNDSSIDSEMGFSCEIISNRDPHLAFDPDGIMLLVKSLLGCDARLRARDIPRARSAEEIELAAQISRNLDRILPIDVESSRDRISDRVECGIRDSTREHIRSRREIIEHLGIPEIE